MYPVSTSALFHEVFHISNSTLKTWNEKRMSVKEKEPTLNRILLSHISKAIAILQSLICSCKKSNGCPLLALSAAKQQKIPQSMPPICKIVILNFRKNIFCVVNKDLKYYLEHQLKGFPQMLIHTCIGLISGEIKRHFRTGWVEGSPTMFFSFVSRKSLILGHA